jgi:hypothetical protein
VSATRARTIHGLLHGPQVHAIGRREVVKTFGDAPRSSVRLPSAMLLGQPSHEHQGVALSRVELIVQRP